MGNFRLSNLRISGVCSGSPRALLPPPLPRLRAVEFAMYRVRPPADCADIGARFRRLLISVRAFGGCCVETGLAGSGGPAGGPVPRCQQSPRRTSPLTTSLSTRRRRLTRRTATWIASSRGTGPAGSTPRSARRSPPRLYGTLRLNFHRFHRFELDLRGYIQP